MKHSSILAFIGGLTAGFVTAMLVAPNSGEQTRDKIKDFMHDTDHRLKEMKACMVKHIEHKDPEPQQS